MKSFLIVFVVVLIVVMSPAYIFGYERGELFCKRNNTGNSVVSTSSCEGLVAIKDCPVPDSVSDCEQYAGKLEADNQWAYITIKDLRAKVVKLEGNNNTKAIQNVNWQEEKDNLLKKNSDLQGVINKQSDEVSILKAHQCGF